MADLNVTVMMTDVAHFGVDQPINPYYTAGEVDLEKAIAELELIREIFVRIGIGVLKIPSPEGSQDGVYTANWALVRGDTAVLARLPETRRAEEEYAADILERLGKRVVRVPEGLKFSGQGDALACGDYLFCGSGYRSDAEAQAFAARELEYELVQLQTVPQVGADGAPVINPVTGWPDSYFYDIDLALAVIKAPGMRSRGLIAYCPEAFTAESRELLANFRRVESIEVSLAEAKEAFATNLVSNGTFVVMSANAPGLAEALRARGLTVVSPTITELAKGGGYIRCVSLTID